MKKVILLLMIAAVMFSCKKTETTSVQPEQKSAEVSFNVNQIFPEVNREDYPFGLPECSDEDPVYAHIIIMTGPTGDPDAVLAFEGDIDLFQLPGDYNLYTQSIKLMLDGCDHVAGGPACCNFFHVTQFMVYDAQDVLIYAAPLAGSDAQGWLDYPERQLDLQFELCEFTKIQKDIDVLCYEEAWYLEFGFVWFNVHEVVMCEICFFVDICQNAFTDYAGDWAPYIPAWDMVGMFSITADKWMGDGVPADIYDGDPEDWVPVDGLVDDVTGEPIFKNYDANGYLNPGEPLCVPFANYLEKDDYYRFFWHVMAPCGAELGIMTWVQSGLLFLDDQCDYSSHWGAGDGVIELLVVQDFDYDVACAESFDWWGVVHTCDARDIAETLPATE